jgi:DNA/RNA endonuclease YhcR with UshA esterase domain
MKKYLVVICFALLVYDASAQTKIAAKDASNYVGKTVTVCDKVYSTKLITSSNMTLLNLGGYYPNQLLTIMIKGVDRIKFKGQPEVDYKGKDVCVTGEVVLYRGKLEIVVIDPKQLLED